MVSPREGGNGQTTGFDIFPPNFGRLFHSGAQRSFNEIPPPWGNSIEILIKNPSTKIIKSEFIKPSLGGNLNRAIKQAKDATRNCYMASSMIQREHFQNSVVGEFMHWVWYHSKQCSHSNHEMKSEVATVGSSWHRQDKNSSLSLLQLHGKKQLSKCTIPGSLTVLKVKLV